MRTILLHAVVAGLALFLWGFASHAVLPWYDGVWHAFTDEAAVAEALVAHSPRRGLYHLPYADAEAGPDRVRAFVNLLPPGTGASVGRQMATGVVIPMFSVLLVLLLLTGRQERTFWETVGFFSAVGLTIGFVSHAYYWNWFGFPTAYVLVVITDLTIGWTLAGLLVAGLRRRGGARPA